MYGGSKVWWSGGSGRWVLWCIGEFWENADEAYAEQTRLEREMAMLLGGLLKLGRERGKLNAFPLRHLLASSFFFTLLRLSLTWLSQKLRWMILEWLRGVLESKKCGTGTGSCTGQQPIWYHTILGCILHSMKLRKNPSLPHCYIVRPELDEMHWYGTVPYRIDPVPYRSGSGFFG